MIIVSARKDFDNPDRLTSTGHLIKEIDLGQNAVIAPDIDVGQLAQQLSGKRVLMLVHGYNTEQDEVYDAYQVIERKIAGKLPEVYDLVIGYAWPGGDKGIEWWTGKHRANAVARRFRFLIELMAGRASSLDLMSHSLGARVVLKALKESGQDDLVRNYWCTAPAVDHECLEPAREFSRALPSCKRLFVFHSARDGVLRLAFFTAERDPALGLFGPEDRQWVSSQARRIFVANCKRCVDHHGGYKHADQLYRYLSTYVERNPAKFKTL
jgi:esterase/lipase superfamily enzyme